MKSLTFLVTVMLMGVVTARSISEVADSPIITIPYDGELVELLSYLPKNLESYKRQKRQFGGFGGGNFGQSSAQAQANAFNQQFGPNGFGASNALAGAQSFNSQGPLGGFGASAANSGSQGFHAGPGGFGGNAAFTGSQTYNLPNKQTVGVSYGGTFANNNGQGTAAQSGGISFS